MKTLLAFLFVLFAPGAFAHLPPAIQTTTNGTLEIAGCSVLPEQHELHYCVHDPSTDVPHAQACDGHGGLQPDGRWFSIFGGSWLGYTSCPFIYGCEGGPGGGAYGYVDWEDGNPATHEGGGVCHHGRGAEAGSGNPGSTFADSVYHVCGDTRNVYTWPQCADGSGAQYISQWNAMPVKFSPNADVNRDAVVGVLDYLAVASCFAQPASCNPNADTNGDGVIGTPDILEIWTRFGRTLSSYSAMGNVVWYYDDLLPGVERGFGAIHLWTEPWRSRLP